MIAVSTAKKQIFLYPGEELKPARSPMLHLHGVSKHATEVGRNRLIVTASLFALAFCLIGGRLVELMVLGPQHAVTSSRSATETPSRHRAAIVDRNGVLVATNLPTVDLFADAQKVLDPKVAADRLVAVLPDLKYDEVLRKLSSGGRFVYLRRHLTPAEHAAVNALGIPGVNFDDSERRTYPQGSLFSHVVGATDTDNLGNAGVEKTFDELLRREDRPLALSLDVRVQHVVRETLAAGISRFKAASGSAVVMDATNGELVAMVSLPDFDPKAIGTASTEARFNRVTLGLYEMGSTFKLFTAAMALEGGTASLDSRYDATQAIKIGRFTIKDFHGENRWLTVPEVLIHSSNIGAAKMALQAGTEAQKAFMRKIGLLTPLSLELPEVGTPQFPSTWRDINTITISYGHGISVTPVHVVSAVSALVNGGVLNPPTVLKRAPGERPPGRQVVSAKTSTAMRAMMRMIVLEGSGKQADVDGYVVGGKTGSAEIVSRRGGYLDNSNRTSFVAAFPIDAPRYVVLVILDEPRGIKETYNFATAGWNAAPTAGAIIAKISPMLGVFPINHTDSFEPLAGMIQTLGSGKQHNEYASAVATMKTLMTTTTASTTTTGATAAEAAVVPAAMAIANQESAADPISELIEAAGGVGELE
jgi:cell division protein FtsI (penicillin-binding protein 3)